MTTLNEAYRGLGRKLSAHERIALAAIAISVTIPKPKAGSNTPSAVVDRELLADLDRALREAGYDMDVIRRRVDDARKGLPAKADPSAAGGR